MVEFKKNSGVQGLKGSVDKGLLIGLGIIGGTLLGIRGCNSFWNNRVINTSAYKTVSHATGLVGHLEYTQYKNSSQEVKELPGIFGHKMVSSTLYEDIDGNGTVDRISVSGPEWKMYRGEIFVRDQNYIRKKELFDKGDRLLVEERTRLNDKLR